MNSTRRPTRRDHRDQRDRTVTRQPRPAERRASTRSQATRREIARLAS